MSSFKDKLDLEKLPQHVAIIMDGNGSGQKPKAKKEPLGIKMPLMPLEALLMHAMKFTFLTSPFIPFPQKIGTDQRMR